jgi:hypothetical protein
MATIPGTRTWAVGEFITASRLNTEIRDALDFILNPPWCQPYDGAGIACANSTATLITMDSESEDSDAMHSTSSLTGRITIITAGVYEFQVYDQLPGATYTLHNLNPRVNSAGSSSGGTSIRTQTFETVASARMTFVRRFNAADEISFYITQTSGASRTTTTGNNVTGMTARLVSL